MSASQQSGKKKGGLRAAWKWLKHLVAYGLIRLVFGVFSRLPEAVLFSMGAMVGRLLCRTGLYRQALKHIKMAYGDEPPCTQYPTAEALARGCMMHMGMLLAEMLLLDRWQPTILERCVPSPGMVELGRSMLSKGHGLVFATGHLANWELFGRAISASGFEVHSMARAAFDARVAQWLVRWRARGGVHVVNRGEREAVAGLRQKLKNGAGLGVLVDVDTPVHSVWVPFFGRLAKTPTAAADLAMKMDAPLMVAWSWREGRGRYGADCVEIPVVATGDRAADAQRITAQVTAVLERAIRAHPEQWVWFHRRWKSPPPPELSTQTADATSATRVFSDEKQPAPA